MSEYLAYLSSCTRVICICKIDYGVICQKKLDYDVNKKIKVYMVCEKVTEVWLCFEKVVAVLFWVVGLKGDVIGWFGNDIR